MKKLISLALALMLVFSLATVAMAATQNPDGSYVDESTITITKTYDATNTDSTSPAETFTFSTPICTSVANAGVDPTTGAVVTTSTAPVPTIGSVTYAAGDAGKTTAMTKTITITLPSYSAVGIYTYTFTENEGTTAGVTYFGDTITLADDPCSEPLPGYRKMNPMVYCGMYPTDNSKYNDLRDALEKLQLNDSSLTFEAESSKALGFGFRIGFLGLLHMEVIQERLEREYNLNLIATAPSVVYKVTLTDGSIVDIDNPSMMPDNTKIDYIEEPYVKASIMVPSDNIGPVMELSQSKRGIYKDMIYIDDNRNQLIYEMPLSEIIFEYFDKLKSVSRGYASLDYELIGYRKSNLVKMDILLNGEMIDALSIIVHRDFAYNRGQKITAKLKELLPKQQFEIPVQAAIGNKIIARTNIKSLRKDVLAKCYGGDISRKKKLLEKQKEGKKRMKAVGSVEIPQEAFMAVLSLDDDE